MLGYAEDGGDEDSSGRVMGLFAGRRFLEPSVRMSLESK
jgi:hypothetical protein